MGRQRLAAISGRVPPAFLLLLSIFSIQLSSALATTLFSTLGPAGTTLTNTVLATFVLTLASPPRIDSPIRRHFPLILIAGLVDAAMALPFMLALQYIALGLAATIGFLGPLGLAVALLGAVLPLALEFQALQRVSARTYGTLVTLEPAAGALVGAICLG